MPMEASKLMGSIKMTPQVSEKPQAPGPREVPGASMVSGCAVVVSWWCGINGESSSLLRQWVVYGWYLVDESKTPTTS